MVIVRVKIYKILQTYMNARMLDYSGDIYNVGVDEDYEENSNQLEIWL